MQVCKKRGITIKKFYFQYIKKLGNALSFELGSIFNRIDDIDILHILTGFFIAHRLPKDAKIVTTIHDVNPIPMDTKNMIYFLKDKMWRYMALERGIRYNFKVSDAIITNSSQTKNEVINLGFDKSKVFVINLGIDKRFFNKYNKIQNSKSKNFNVGYIGSFAINKNINFILESAILLGNKVNFSLWGSKTYNYQNLSKKAEGLKSVKFMGFASEEKIINIYDSFDAFAFPSLYEGFGFPILEAQSRGLPVIIYKYGKIPKEVKKYCFEAESPEHMAQIIENLKENGYNEKLRKKAMAYARSFTWEKCAIKTVKVYKQLTKV